MADDTRVTHSRTGLACAVVLLCALGCVLPPIAAAADIVVQRSPGLSAAERAELRAEAGVQHERTLAVPDTEVVRVPDEREAAALAQLNADPHVRSAAVNVPLHVADVPTPPNDPFFPLQRGLENTDDADLDISEAWTLSMGTGVKVAVVDQQVDVTHPDLAPAIQADLAKDFIADKGCGAPAPTRANDHGTLVAGAIAAARNNARGIAGVAPDTKIVPVRAIDNCGDTDLEIVLEALHYAASSEGAGASIVNLSFATSPLSADEASGVNQQLVDLMREYEETTLFVVAAGNAGNNNDEIPVYPCSTRDAAVRMQPANLVCVGMTDRRDVPVCTANVGVKSVTLFAPGDQIFSTASPNRYEASSGTSMAAALTSGVAALVAAPELPPAELKTQLVATVDSSIPGLGPWVAAGGRLNAARLLGADRQLGAGGPGGGWASCDRDHDEVRDELDDCPDTAALDGINGCPDADGDGVVDKSDNCPAKHNPDQLNADGDLAGDVCDPSPRGPDADGDGKPALDDRCPDEYALTADGCPEPTVTPTPTPPPDDRNRNPVPNPTPVPPAPTPIPDTPRVTSVAVKVSPKSCKGRKGCKQSAKVTVKVSRSATVALKVEHKQGRTWRQVTFKSLKASMAGKSLTVRGKRGKSLTRGSYRVTVTINGVTTLKTFKV